MAIDLLSPRFRGQYEDNPEHNFAYTMNYLKESAYAASLEDENDGNFTGIVLSGTETGETTGTGTGAFDHRLITINEKEYMEIKVRRKDGKGVAAMISDPSDPSFSPAERHKLIKAHEWARSEEPWEGDVTSLSAGGEVVCYYEKGSTRNSNFSGLRFKAPIMSGIFEQFLQMGMGEGGLMGLFSGAMNTIGNFLAGGGGLPATCRDRSRPPDSITLHYNVGYSNQSPQSVYDGMIKRDVAYHVLIGGNGDYINPVPYDKYVIHGHGGNSGVGVCFLNMGWGGSKYQPGGAKHQKALAGQVGPNGPWQPGPNPNGGDTRYWDPYTPQQVQQAVQICAQICNRYNLNPLTDIYPHSHFSKKKQDVGPLFPINAFKTQVQQAMPSAGTGPAQPSPQSSGDGSYSGGPWAPGMNPESGQGPGPWAPTDDEVPSFGN